MYGIAKRFTFEAAHILDEAYSKECTVVHGHSYKVEFHLSVDNHELNEENYMVLDFKTLKEIVDPIIARFDHALIISDERYLKEYVDVTFKQKLVILPNSPTAEVLAKYFFDAVKSDARVQHTLKKVKVWETEKAFAVYSE